LFRETVFGRFWHGDFKREHESLALPSTIAPSQLNKNQTTTFKISVPKTAKNCLSKQLKSTKYIGF